MTNELKARVEKVSKFEIKEQYYPCRCTECGFLGSSEHFKYLSNGDDGEVVCHRDNCHGGESALEMDDESLWRRMNAQMCELIKDQQSRIEELEADKKRLDFLDGCNAAMNKKYGTTYGWKFDINHNRVRCAVEGLNINDFALYDTGHPVNKTCRKVIDEAIAATAAHKDNIAKQALNIKDDNK